MRILFNRIFFLEMDNAIELAYIRDNQNVQRGVTPFDIKPGEKYASLN